MRLSTDMVRDPDADALVATVNATGQPELWERGVDGARAYIDKRAAEAAPGPAVDVVEDDGIAVDGRRIPVRIYRPAGANALPVVVYFHGGGWVVGGLDASDAFCRRLVNAVPCVLVSVGYRLAPEHPFPAGVEDAVAAVTWAAGQARAWQGDPARLVVLGDSAGANLATVAVRRLLAAGGPAVARQILAYPTTAGGQGPSGGRYGREWPLTDAELEWFLDQYATDDAARVHPDVAPALADVAGLPPTTLLLGGCDPLLVEGLAYAERLWTSGVSVDLHLYTGQIHGFLTFDEAVLPRSREALGTVANAIRNAGA